MEGFLPIFFLGVVLKIPIFAGLYLIYWAVRAEPELDDARDDGDHGFRRWRTDPRPPRGPRRGPHQPDARPLPECPPGGRLRDVRRPVPARINAAGASERSR
jgi:hypothetical protein